MFLVTLRDLALPVQVSELFVDFFPQVVQAFQVFARVSYAVLCLASPLPELGDTCRLLEEHAQFFRFRLDQARDHALLDDRVCPWTETGPEKQRGDVFAAATRVVQIVIRDPVSGDFATYRHFGVASVLATDAVIGVIENKFDGGRTNRFARTGAVEDHVGHRIATQMLCGHFAHDPTDGIDHVRLTTSVRAHDTRQVALKVDGGGVNE